MTNNKIAPYNTLSKEILNEYIGNVFILGYFINPHHTVFNTTLLLSIKYTISSVLAGMNPIKKEKHNLLKLKTCLIC